MLVSEHIPVKDWFTFYLFSLITWNESKYYQHPTQKPVNSDLLLN